MINESVKNKDEEQRDHNILEERIVNKSDSKRKNFKGFKSGEIKEQFIEKLISVRRVTKVVKGGKNMHFSALVVVGDGKGKVGYATAKAREVPDAVKKASDLAKRSMIKVSLLENRTIRCDVYAKVGSGHVFLRTAPAGTGVIAGGPMRSIFDSLGIKDIVSKSIGSRTYHNVVNATFTALKRTVSPKYIANKLGKKFIDIAGRRHASHMEGGDGQ